LRAPDERCLERFRARRAKTKTKRILGGLTAKGYGQKLASFQFKGVQEAGKRRIDNSAKLQNRRIIFLTSKGYVQEFVRVDVLTIDIVGAGKEKRPTDEE
jgi:hypothetical protein